MAIEEPAFELLEQFGIFQLRLYAPRVMAETTVDGTLAQASAAGFRRIARYLFGDNLSNAVTHPEADARGITAIDTEHQKIAMTTPLSAERVGGRWRVQLAMPRRHTLETLPRPRHPGVMLIAVPAQQTAVLVFSGRVRPHTVDTKTRALLAWLLERRLEPISTPRLACYNPPWTLPFLRRNEILIDYR